MSQELESKMTLERRVWSLLWVWVAAVGFVTPVQPAIAQERTAPVSEFARYRAYASLDRAYRLLAEGNLTQARREVEHALEQTPGNWRAGEVRLLILHQLGEHGAAVRQADQVLRVADSLPALLYGGLARLAQREWDGAVKSLGRAAVSSRATPEERRLALNSLAEAALGLGDGAEVLRALDRLAHADRDVEYHRRRASALELLQRDVEAAVAYDAALAGASSPGIRASLLRARAELARRTGDMAAAERAYVALSELLPSDVDALQAAAELAHARRDFNAVADRLRRLVLFDATQQEPLADALASAGRLNEAVVELRKVIAAATPQERPRLQLKLGRTLESSGRAAEALAVYTHRTLARNVEALRAAAVLHEAGGQTALAIDVLERVARLQPTPDIWLRLGTLLTMAGQDTRAIAPLVQAERSMDTAVRRAALERLGRAYQRLERHGEARTALSQVLALAPHDVTLRDALAASAAATGDQEAVVTHLEAASVLEPTGSRLAALAAAYAGSGELERAVSTYGHAIALTPGGAPELRISLLALGDLEMTRGNHERAAAAYIGAADAGGAATAWARAARAYDALGRPQDAIDADLKALLDERLTGDDRLQVLRHLAFAYLRAGMDERAASTFADLRVAGQSDRHLLENYGLTLGRLGRWAEARVQFEAIPTQQRTAHTFLFLARTGEALNRPALALASANAAAAREAELTSDERRSVFELLAAHYTLQGDHAAAAQAWGRALALARDEALALKRARALRLAGEAQLAADALARIDGRTLPPADRAQLEDERAEVYLALERTTDAIAALGRAIDIQPTAHRHSRRGAILRRVGSHVDAVSDFERAVALEPDGVGHLVELGYAASSAGSVRQAVDAFESAIKHDSSLVTLNGELGYLYMRSADNRRAIRAFQRAIDVTGGGDGDGTATRARLRREIDKMSDVLDVLLFTGSSLSGADARAASGAPGGESVMAGAEVAWKPPVIGFRNGRTFQVFGRMWWDLSGTPFDLGGGRRGGVGVRYKPLTSQNFFVSAERIFVSQGKADHDWLFRGLYSLTTGTHPTRRFQAHSQLYGDVAYYLGPRSTAAYYGEARQGMRVRVGPGVLVTPQVRGDVRYEDTGNPSASYIEGGPGAALTVFFDGNAGAAGPALEISGHYQWRRYFGSGQRSHGWVGAAALRF